DKLRLKLSDGSIDLNDISELGARMVVKDHFNRKLIDVDDLSGLVYFNSDRCPLLGARKLRSPRLYIKVLLSPRRPEFDFLLVRGCVDEIAGHKVVSMGVVALAMDVNDGVVFIHLHLNLFPDFEPLGGHCRRDSHRSPRRLYSSQTGLHLRDDAADFHVRRPTWLSLLVGQALGRN